MRLSFRTIFASAIGTILEWYDFSLFAFLTPVLAHLFFPQQNPLTALMFTYAIFAIGFIARPVGAALFGHWGDRIGRKKMLILSIALMTAPTFFIGLLPTYSSIGIFAPILLILLRLCQGVSAGGEATGAVLFVVESQTYKNRGFVAALIWAVVGIGMLMGSFAAMFVSHYPNYGWLWRVPFLLGIVTGFVGYFVRKKLPEPKLFQHMMNQGERVRYPLRDGLINHHKEMLVIIAIYSLSAMITYVIFVFMPTFVANVVGLPLKATTLISTLGLTCVTLLVPAGGYLSDRIGRKKSLGIGAFGFLILSYPLFHLIVSGSIADFAIAEAIFVLLAATFQGTINAAVVEQVPTAVRFSLVAVGYNLSYSLFGGTAPLIATYLVTTTGLKVAPAFYLMFGAVLALIAAITMRETAHHPLA